ncbi:EscU/YscU/HrcU family type III secretion system export apparatus switch protein [Alkalicoccus daliensis]|uniref:Flagellar biosynthesis protein n=1 Tax=Alkalicoccus daliensis TaxID=745820 RepID=A0A1H0B205_9BACI|nr:EscU/YscU/HrcU family type III secretion system export apparatus switch protein [Alkalicoccus daliensis]SDN39702.1 flagellar biosynthesis protein [Alkalicoccus daliensis]
MIVQKHFNQVNRRQINGPSAVVISYDEAEGNEPRVIASGKGYVAEKILKMAEENNIHMEEDASLLENLLDLDLGENVPPQLYAVIAEILLLIEELERSY